MTVVKKKEFVNVSLMVLRTNDERGELPCDIKKMIARQLADIILLMIKSANGKCKMN